MRMHITDMRLALTNSLYCAAREEVEDGETAQEGYPFPSTEVRCQGLIMLLYHSRFRLSLPHCMSTCSKYDSAPWHM